MPQPFAEDLQLLAAWLEKMRRLEAETVATVAWWRGLLAALRKRPSAGLERWEILPLWRRHRLLVSRDLEAAELRRLWRPAKRRFWPWGR